MIEWERNLTGHDRPRQRYTRPSLPQVTLPRLLFSPCIRFLQVKRLLQATTEAWFALQMPRTPDSEGWGNCHQAVVNHFPSHKFSMCVSRFWKKDEKVGRCEEGSEAPLVVWRPCSGPRILNTEQVVATFHHLEHEKITTQNFWYYGQLSL